MSNFTAFNEDYVKSVVEPFLPGGTGHITPVRYEAITPDIFAFLFRTTGRDATDHFFVALEYDYVKDVSAIESIITKWHGSFLELWTPDGQPVSSDIRAMSVPTEGPYYAAFAEVGPPRSPSYWTDNKVLYADMPLDDFLLHFDEGRRQFIRDNVISIRQKSPDAAIAVYAKEDGTTEYFYS